MNDEWLATVGYLGLFLADFFLLLHVNLSFLYVDGVRQQAHVVRKGLCFVFSSSLLQGLIPIHHVVLDIFIGDGASLGQIERVGLQKEAHSIVVAAGHSQIAGIGTEVIYFQIFRLPVLLIEGLGLVELTVCCVDHGLVDGDIVVANMINIFWQVLTALLTG